jgi:23S rRNA pseudouridine1911/1915/1917 synthase
MEAPNPRREAVDQGWVGERLDRFLASRIPQVSRSRLKELIEHGKVALDGKPVTHASRRLEAGQVAEVWLEPEAPARLVAEDLPLEVLFEDERLLVINKPAGLVVHPGAGNRSGTLVHALVGRPGMDFPEEEEAPGEDGPRMGLIHRLDKDTSGVLVVTKNPQAQERYARLFAERQTRKQYLAIVKGGPREDQGRIQTLYGRHPHNRLKFTGRVSHGKTAITEWRVLARGRLASVLEVGILTGRTHQIRVHCAEAGFPVLGDLLYGQPLQKPAERGSWSEFEVLFRLPRQALHAWKLSFPDPFTGEQRAFTAPLPADLDPALRLLGLPGLDT